MPRYQVPQFIEEKTKIVGPLTLPQFFYVGGAGAVAIFSFYVFNTLLAFIISIIAGGIGVSLAFIKINGQSLPRVILAALQYWQKPSEYVWKRETPTTTLDLSSVKKIEAARRDISLQGRIKKAALNIATGKFNLFSGDKSSKEKPKGNYQVVTHSTGEKDKAKRVDYT